MHFEVQVTVQRNRRMFVQATRYVYKGESVLNSYTGTKDVSVKPEFGTQPMQVLCLKLKMVLHYDESTLRVFFAFQGTYFECVPAVATVRLPIKNTTLPQ